MRYDPRSSANQGTIAGRLLAFALAGIATLTSAAAARAEIETPSKACDDLTDYLLAALSSSAPLIPGPSFIDPGYDARERRLEESLRSTSPATPMSYARRVTPECRAEVQRATVAAKAAIEAARAWTRRSERGWVERGRVVRCAMQDDMAYDEIASWMADAYAPEVRAVCASALATWPDAQALRSEIFTRAVRRNHESWADWQVDEAVVAAVNVLGTAELRDQLVPVLITAHQRQALGYDRLRDAVCTDDGAMSSERASAGSSIPASAEHAWRASERPGQWMMRGGATAAYAGLVAAVYLDRNGKNGRAMPTIAGVLGGAEAGVLAVWIATHPSRLKADDHAIKSRILLGMLAGGVAGGLLTNALAASPGARAPLTALGLAPVYLTVLAGTFD